MVLLHLKDIILPNIRIKFTFLLKSKENVWERHFKKLRVVIIN